jgi:hypothetical protein
VHGRTKTGELVSYENPGKMDLQRARESGVTPAKLRNILACMYEYITLIEREETNRLIALEKEEDGDDGIDNHAATGGGKGGRAKGKSRTDPRRTARLMTVVDVGGLSIGNLNKDTFSFLLTAGDIMDNYYPVSE